MRKQRAFASLTEQEIDQVADWLRHDNYDHVRERIAQPRPEGFGLIISNKPLQILFARKNTVDKINHKLESGQKLTLAEFESITGGQFPCASCSAENEHNVQRSMKENSRIAQIHTAIIETTYDLVTSDDNTPTQLLALQKLADFPARAALRARKEERELETREHKIQMDLHRKEMAEHRKHIANERLSLAKCALQLREKQLAGKTSDFNPQPSDFSDHLGPLAMTLDDLEARATRKFNLPPPTGRTGAPPVPAGASPADSNRPFKLWTADDILHNQPKVEAAIQSDPFLSQIGLPPENPPGRDDFHVVPNSAPSSEPQPREASDQKCQMQNAHLDSRSEQQNLGTTFEAALGMSLPNSTGTSKRTEENTETLESRVNKYTLARYHEALIGKDPTKVGRSAAFNFHSSMDRCPCGKHLPCPDHGDFPPRFFEISPDDADYFYCFEKKKLPFTSAQELLRREAEQPEPAAQSGEREAA